MQVVDWEHSEHGPQRKKTIDGRPLHCCCICGKLEPWNDNWAYFASLKELDDAVPIPKFCSTACRNAGGHLAERVTEEMKRTAKEREWREPVRAYREATGREKYDAAASQQRRDRERVSIAQGIETEGQDAQRLGAKPESPVA